MSRSPEEVKDFWKEYIRSDMTWDKICPVVKEYLNKRMKDYEAYDTMHDNDGIVGKSVCARRL